MADVSRTNITHVIFDVDGLLLDTESIYSQVIESICAEYGKHFTWEIKAKQMGQTETKAATIVIEELQLPLTAEEYIKRCKKSFQHMFPQVHLLPGAERLVRHLHQNKVPIAIASGSDQHNFDLKTVNHQNIFGLFHHAVLCSSDPEVQHGKPAPDCFLVAAARFPDRPEPQRVLVFEDAPNGVQSALAAGMQVVWVPDPRADHSQFKDQPVITLQSLEHFEPKDFDLPAYVS